MSRVDFYILPENGAIDRLRYACRLAEKAWRAQQPVYVHAPARAVAEELDDLLWTFRDISFVPHALADEDVIDAPIRIGWDIAQAGAAGLIINLAEDIPEGIDGFARIAEIVGGGEAERQRARARYRSYRAAGHELFDHQIPPGRDD
jgi:DNA polymerase-3 subunit chi